MENIERLKQMASEMLYEDEGFLVALREKFGNIEGEKVLKKLETKAINKVKDFLYLNDEEKILTELGKFIKKLKDKYSD